jgi:hypothetical protein
LILFFATDMLYSSAIRAVLEIVIFIGLLTGERCPGELINFSS